MRSVERAVAAIERQPSVEALYRADADRLWRSVYAFSGDAEVASDAVAEAYAQLIRRGDAVRDAQAWTWRAAFKIANGSLKSSRRTAAMAPSFTDAATDKHADPDLAAALVKLPPNQRAAVVLFYYADLQIGDIARRLGTNSIAVRANLSRGRRRLRELLGERDG